MTTDSNDPATDARDRVSRPATPDQVFRFGEFVLDDQRAALYRDGIETALRPKCFEVLRLLVANAGRLVTKEQLLDEVWSGVVVTEGSVAQCVAEIRRALGDTQQAIIRTVPRRGFIFQLPVNAVTAVPVATAPDQGRRWLVALGALALLLAATWWTLGRMSAGPPGSAGTADATPPQNSIAVLRFTDLSPAGDQAYFADGLAEEILHLLARSKHLRVTARTSSFALAPGSADTATIGRELGVAYVLEGSVRREGDSLRITSQLINAATGFHVWSETYDRRLDNILQLQRDVAADVGAALNVALAPARDDTGPAQARAYEAFLLGRHLFHRRHPGDLLAAEQHLERAVQLDPANASAWTVLAAVYSVRGMDELGDSSYRLEEQRRALERALEIDPTLAEAHVRLARYFYVKGDPVAIRASLTRAFELAPNDSMVLHARHNLALAEGRLEDALDFRRQATAVNPLSAVYRSNLGHSLLAAGYLEEGLQELRRARELSASTGWGADIAAALLLLGKVDDARREMEALPEGPDRDKLLVLLGPEAESRAILGRLEQDASGRGRLRLAEIAAYRGDRDRAFGYLESIVAGLTRTDWRKPDFRVWQFIYSSALVGTLRSDGRWPGLVDKIRQIVSLDGFAADSADDGS